ncbi:MAG: protein translocase subunit SecD [Muribaculaceae bacterium]|nr:protein translocase subunit SecD [Roseburia sp.]MCM1430629.1 protein translocase subunit SecD [Muribaculaceae bacterium]MCM1491896.1 protein translocase subunit SecD [Muribaculaceae bacterium]
MKKSKGVVIIAVILACLIGLGYYAATIMSSTSVSQSNTDNQALSTGIKLGLDLSGGVSITYQIVDENPSQTDVNDTVAKLEERAESYSTEYSVYPVGDDRITVEIPGVYDANAVLAELGSPGTLYFIKHYDSSGSTNYEYDSASGAYVLTKDIDTLLADGSIVLDGNDVQSASAGYQNDQTMNSSKPVVELVFSDDAAEIWAAATTEAYNNSQDTIGVYYDDHFISVPQVSTIISDGHCVIEGMGGYEEAEQLATFIRVGAINLELAELESKVVGAQLGGQALSTSIRAAIIGLVLVMLFMIVMYGLSGVVASVGLGIYTFIVVSFIYLFEITLTLPGIAGVILGIGMAVDANVIIISRMREELAGGKSVLTSIKEGYKRALPAIIDGQLTTFIAALVLMWLGSGTVKGFAYTLMISIIVSVFTALVVSRYLNLSLYAVGFQNEKLYGKAKERKNFDFLAKRKVFFAISVVVILAGFVGMGANAGMGKGALNFSLEFAGGTAISADFGKDYTVEEVEAQIVPELANTIGDSAIQASTVSGSTAVEFKTRTLELEEREAVNNMFVEKFGVDASTIESQSIGSTISGEMRKDAFIAVIVACICMLLYIWFRFKDIRFAGSAILALVHDVLVVLTAYALIRISVGGTFIACMLTILGYSINDTIVVFDRVRENLHGVKKATKESLVEVANKSLTQTLSRSINTSITTFVMVLLLFILGVASIREFALPLMAGLISGTYSSIFIATSIWYEMKLHLGRGRLVKKSEK